MWGRWCTGSVRMGNIGKKIFCDTYAVFMSPNVVSIVHPGIDVHFSFFLMTTVGMSYM